MAEGSERVMLQKAKRDSSDARTLEDRSGRTACISAKKNSLKGKKKSSSVCEAPITKPPVQSSVSTYSLRSLDDNEFRNLLDNASIPRYSGTAGNNLSGGDDSSRRRSEANDRKLTAEADTILARFMREAEKEQRKIDRESEKLHTTVTAYIKEAEVNAKSRKLVNSLSQDSWTVRNRSNRAGGDAAEALRKESVEMDLHTCALSGGPNVSDNVKLFEKTEVNEYTYIGLSSTQERDAATNTSGIAFIDEDDHSDSDKGFSKNANDACSRENFKHLTYPRKGNIIQEMRPLNDSDGDDLVGLSRNIGQVLDRSTTSNAHFATHLPDSTLNSNVESTKRTDYDDNSFHYTSGQLHVGKKQGSYEMTQSPSIEEERRKRGVQPQPDILLLSQGETGNSLLSHDLSPAEYRPREQFSSKFLLPTDNTRLAPYPNSQEIEVANLKKNGDGHSEKFNLTRQRRLNKKAKEKKNVYVVGESEEGYWGNLPPDEIVKRIEGVDNSSKTKGSHKCGFNGTTKDHGNSVTVGGAKAASGIKKKADKGKQHPSAAPEKQTASPKHSSAHADISPPTSKPKNMNIGAEPLSGEEDCSSAFAAADLVPSGDDSGLPSNSKAESTVGEQSSDHGSEGDSGAMAGVVDEEMNVDEMEADDEEQYVSADEGVNSAASDEVYHTDDWSGRSLMSDGANYRADDEVIALNSITTEEAEFIQVTTKNKKKSISGMPASEKRISAVSGVDKPLGQRPLTRTDNLRQCRNSAQQIPEGNSVRAGQFSSAAEHKKFGGAPNRRQLNSLADFIEDNTVIKGQSQKVLHHGSWAKSYNNPGQLQKPHTDSGRPVQGAPSSLQTSRAGSPDRRGSQPAVMPAGRYAAAVAQNSHKSASTDLAMYPTGPQGSFTKALPSSSHRDDQKAVCTFALATAASVSPPVASLTVSDAVQAAQQSISASDARKVIVYDPTDEQANPPLPLAANPPSALFTDMTNTACVNLSSNASSVAGRSYADIAKSKSSTSGATSRASDNTSLTSPREMSPDLNTPSTSSNGDRCISAASSVSGCAEVNESREEAHRSSESETLVDSGPLSGPNSNEEDNGVRGFSFFFDPNEPTASFDQSSPVIINPSDFEDYSLSTPIACPQNSTVFMEDEIIPNRTAAQEEFLVSRAESRERCREPTPSGNGVTLNLPGGKTLVLRPAVPASSPPVIDQRRHMSLIEQLSEHWKIFQQGSAPVRYKDISFGTTMVSAD